MAKPTVNKGGRPLFEGKNEKEVVSKLEEAFMWGCTDVEACLYANISKSALYRYIEKHPSFGIRKEDLKKSTTMAAKRNVYKEVGAGDVNTSKWVLEKTDDSYNPKAKQEHSGTINIKALSYGDYYTSQLSSEAVPGAITKSVGSGEKESSVQLAQEIGERQDPVQLHGEGGDTD